MKEVSFSCQKGLINGVIGGNGSGKSTVARLMAGMIQPLAGTIKVDGASPFAHIIQCGFLAGIIFQNPENQIVGTTVEEDLAFGLENLSLDREQMHSRVAEIARRFNLYDLLKAPVANLSGGQKQLLCIASVMVMEPSWLIFDEPSSHLDPWARQDFWQIVKSFICEKDIGVVVISQLPEDMQHFSHILAFDAGALVFDGTSNQFKKAAIGNTCFNLPESWKFERLMQISND
ncbi:MAG: ATP-binding cassette domain-containing protein [Candidatus Riflebacteria bacterium]|nr:ATP-binding cassette domain-containing protein [Candidatus Riflebacteria bacterium]